MRQTYSKEPTSLNVMRKVVLYSSSGADRLEILNRGASKPKESKATTWERLLS